MGKSCDYPNKLIAAFDSGFPHAGAKATSGVVVFLNGVAIAWKTRQQTAGLSWTEVEVKAMVPGISLVRGLAASGVSLCMWGISACMSPTSVAQRSRRSFMA